MYKRVFLSCWLAYFSAYLGRMSFAAVIVDITDVISKSEAGSVASVGFITYAVGQVINGILSRFISPYKMMLTGLLLSAAMNLCMSVTSTFPLLLLFWGINGFAQSMLWPAIVKIISASFGTTGSKKAFRDISSAIPVGTICSYLSAVFSLQVTGRETVFQFSSVILVIVAFSWIIFMPKSSEYKVKENEIYAKNNLALSHSKIKLPIIGLIFIGAVVLIHGMLKDGIAVWIPSFLADGFNVSSSSAVLSVVMLPLINLLGIYITSFLSSKLIKNEMFLCFVLFGVTALSTMLLLLCNSIFTLSLICFIMLTFSMSGANLVLTGYLPIKFKGNESTAAGFLNGLVYVGTGLSTFATGAVAENSGWTAIKFIWLILSIGGMISCFFLYYRASTKTSFRNHKNMM